MNSKGQDLSADNKPNLEEDWDFDAHSKLKRSSFEALVIVNDPDPDYVKAPMPTKPLDYGLDWS